MPLAQADLEAALRNTLPIEHLVRSIATIRPCLTP